MRLFISVLYLSVCSTNICKSRSGIITIDLWDEWTSCWIQKFISMPVTLKIQILRCFDGRQLVHFGFSLHFIFMSSTVVTMSILPSFNYIPNLFRFWTENILIQKFLFLIYFFSPNFYTLISTFMYYHWIAVSLRPPPPPSLLLSPSLPPSLHSPVNLFLSKKISWRMRLL